MSLTSVLEDLAQNASRDPGSVDDLPAPEEDESEPEALAYVMGLMRALWGPATALEFLRTRVSVDPRERPDVSLLLGRLAAEAGEVAEAVGHFEDAAYHPNDTYRHVAAANLVALASELPDSERRPSWRKIWRETRDSVSGLDADLEAANEYWRSRVGKGALYDTHQIAMLGDGPRLPREDMEVSFAAHFLKFTMCHMRISVSIEMGDANAVPRALDELEIVAVSAATITPKPPPIVRWMIATFAVTYASYAAASENPEMLWIALQRMKTEYEKFSPDEETQRICWFANMAAFHLEYARLTDGVKAVHVQRLQDAAHSVARKLGPNDARSAIASTNAALASAEFARTHGATVELATVLREAERQMARVIGENSDGVELIRREIAYFSKRRGAKARGGTIVRERLKTQQGVARRQPGEYVGWSTAAAAARVAKNRTVAVKDIGSAEDFLAAVEKTLKSFQEGDIVEGTVVKIDRDEVLLDVGYKTEGVIPSRELSIKHDVDPNEVVNVGDHVEALVLQKEDKEGRLILSKKRAQYERAWGDVEKIKENDGVVTGSVIEVVKGGLIVDIGLRGFLPASHIELGRVRDLAPYLGQEIEAKILELDKNRNNVVLSRRALLEQTQSESRTTFLNNLHKGQVRTGTVSSIDREGVLVDLGGVDGLIANSELIRENKVVDVGQEVTVEILEVDLDRDRVSLSLMASEEDLWRAFARTHAIGQIVPGKVTKLVPFGAFVRVADGIEGLVHISELSGKHVELAEQVVSVGEEVFVKIIDIDLERRRISLSLKQANESVDPNGTEFDPALYGMVTEYDERGEYKYPQGFDAERERLEQQAYAAARSRWEAHKAAVAKARETEAGDSRAS